MLARIGRHLRLFMMPLACIITMALTSAGCGTGTKASPDGQPEKSKITVGLLPAPPVSALYLARERGFFRQEGLDVQFKEFTGGAAGMPTLLSGRIDILFSNSISIMQAYAKGLPVRILLEADVAGENQFPIMVPKNSQIDTPVDLKGKKIAVNNLRNLAELALTSTLQIHGVNIKRDNVQLVEVPFPQMGNALKNKSVDAAWMLEPFASQAESKFGTMRVTDTMIGPTARLSLGAYAATEKWTQSNPQTSAAFKRAMHRANVLAATDRRAVEAMVPLVTHGQIDKETASVIKLTDFATSTNSVRLQRVADLGFTYGLIEKKIDARKIVV
jgi:NitT/TauT family transport system substrate-binding protein